MVYAVTGHRPVKLYKTDHYSKENQQRLVRYLVQVIPPYKPTLLIVGMALGFDQAVTSAAIQLSIPFAAAIPFKGQESKWNKEAQQVYFDLLDHAESITIVSEGGYSSSKMHIRDRWMVDRAERLLGLYNGQPGGTAETIKYAESCGKICHNLWAGWEFFEDEGV